MLPGLLQLHLCPPELQEMGDGMDSCPRNKDVAHVYLRDSSGLYHEFIYSYQEGAGPSSQLPLAWTHHMAFQTRF